MQFTFYDGKTGEQYILPELYQPVYGHPEFDNPAQRNCRDRLEHIYKVYDALEKELQRPLRVLDLGCNQGFISFSLAARGGVVTGIDSEELNIKFCNLLSEENPNLNVKFIRARIEDFVPAIQPGEYDLVLGLSIFRDLYETNGFDKVEEILKDLAEKVPCCIFEPELQSEPDERSKFLPEKYTYVFTGFLSIKVLARTPAENSDVKRPLLFAGKNYLYFENSGLLKVDNSHHHNTLETENYGKLYCFCGNKFVKLVGGWNETAIEYAEYETKFLKKFGGRYGFPKLYDAEVDDDECGKRFFVVRDKLEGITLEEKIRNGENFNHWDVIRQVLEQLVFLEENGYYHNDIQQHNILCNENGKVYVIDYESISDKKSFFTWPHDLLQAFFIFINNVLENKDLPLTHSKSKELFTRLKQHIGDKKFSRIMRIKDSEKYFARLYEILFASDDDETFDGYTVAEHELFAVEEYLEEIDKRLDEYLVYFGQVDAYMQGLKNRIEELEKNLT